MSTLAYALHYLELGWSVIPVACETKKPLIAWKEYQARRATVDEVVAWWRQWPAANIGVVTGAVSGLIVLDIDGEAGEASLARCGPLPLTPMVRTGKGRHIYFAHPGAVIRNFARKLPGLDLRGDGGYVVAPPSLHASGARYTWEVAPDGLPL